MTRAPLSWLAHPLTRGRDIDAPRTTTLRRRIVREKKFLRQIYREWYAAIARALPEGEEPVLELGSGAGFMSEAIPQLVTSEVFYCPGVRLVLDGTRLPFCDGALRGIVMTDVLHHIPRPRDFFSEATRCVAPGGVVAMVEPWVSPWSRWVYRHLHHEPFEPEAADWGFPSGGPLSGANGALPWILFERDRERFENEFPGWRIRSLEPFMPFRYLVSGGISMRALMPGWTFRPWRRFERLLTPWMRSCAMFAGIVLDRVEAHLPRRAGDHGPG